MNNSGEPLYLTARDAATELAVSPATLYAYVSRGLIRSEPGDNPRSRRYRAEDVRGLKNRRAPLAEIQGLKSAVNALASPHNGWTFLAGSNPSSVTSSIQKALSSASSSTTPSFETKSAAERALQAAR